MSSTFKFHSQVNETVPWQAQYTFPTQATRVNKQVVKLPPKNGGSFTPGNIIRIEFPADNYLNTLNSVLSFDLALTGTNPFLQRGGAHNVIRRLRVMYGSLVIEDIQEYHTLVRIFTEAGVQDDYQHSYGSILDGMYQSHVSTLDATAAAAITANAGATVQAPVWAQALGASTRTYCLNLMSGLLTCKKLIPLKWMAAQLAIEITLSDAADAMLVTGGTPGFTVSDVNYIAEMLEFDSTYDTAFYAGLQNQGVPLKFSSWHFHTFNITGATSVLQIHERSRSVKAAFAVVRDTKRAASGAIDSDRFFYTIGDSHSAAGLIEGGGAGAIQQFQWRVGGRYYPAQPVKCTNGAAEAVVELTKCLNLLGDYTRASSINFQNWVTSKFIMSCEFENTDVMPDSIAGINAEEQSDIALSITAAAAPDSKKVDVFMHFDALIIVRDGNLVDLVL